MLIEILIILLIIIVALLFLIFFNTWHLHILFKSHNLDYSLSLKLKFLFIQIIINKITTDATIIINLKVSTKEKQLFSKQLNSQTNNNIEEESKNTSGGQKELFSKIKEIYPYLYDSKEELYNIIKSMISIVSFNNSCIHLSLGLGDNNTTIKLCSLIWALTAPLYPLQFQLVLTPQINKAILKSRGDITIDIKLKNLLKIMYYVLKIRNLREIIKIIVR